VLNKYMMKYAKETMESGRFGETIAAFAQFGIRALPQNYPIYKTLILEIFVDCDPFEIEKLRLTLLNFQQELKEDLATPAGKEFTKYLTIAHLLNLKQVYTKKNLSGLLLRLNVSLLRYCDLIRLDKLYYDAGMSCKKKNNLSLAFMLLNRYLDIYEVIDDPENNNIGDHDDFANSDIPSPFDVPLPEENLIDQS